MRALAAQLGVAAPSLYHHVPGKASLLDGVHEAVLAEMRPVAPTSSARSNLEALAREFRRVLLVHPRAVALLATRPSRGERALALSEQAVLALVHAGFVPECALAAWQTLAVFVLGHALAEVGEPAGDVDDEGAAPAILDRFPALGAAAARGGGDLEPVFELGLQTLLDGFTRSMAG